MKSFFASPELGMIGLLFFFCFFCGVVVWAFRPNSKKSYEEKAKIPLKEED